MKEPAIRLFRELEAAQAARQRLLDSGFAPDTIELSSQGDEAGGVKGNFYAGDHQPSDALGAEQDRYDQKFRDVEFGTVCLLTVHAGTDSEHARALEMLEQAGGEPPDVGGAALDASEKR